jgi:hypothetical protein
MSINTYISQQIHKTQIAHMQITSATFGERLTRFNELHEIEMISGHTEKLTQNAYNMHRSLLDITLNEQCDLINGLMTNIMDTYWLYSIDDEAVLIEIFDLMTDGITNDIDRMIAGLDDLQESLCDTITNVTKMPTNVSKLIVKYSSKLIINDMKKNNWVDEVLSKILDYFEAAKLHIDNDELMQIVPNLKLIYKIDHSVKDVLIITDVLNLLGFKLLDLLNCRSVFLINELLNVVIKKLSNFDEQSFVSTLSAQMIVYENTPLPRELCNVVLSYISIMNCELN